MRIQIDHGKKFENQHFEDYDSQHKVKHEYSSPKMSQQNRVVEHKNRTLQEMACVMLNAK